MCAQLRRIYDEIVEGLDEYDHEDYQEKEMEKISRKISNFQQSLDANSMKTASRIFVSLMYIHYERDHGKVRTLPYKGKHDRETPALDFDLKNIPPVLARILAKFIDDYVELTTPQPTQ